jgi:hypothetical protein
VRGLLDLADEVAAEHDADRTAKWHRGLVRALVGVKYDAGKSRDPQGGHDEGQPGRPDQRGA